MISDTLDTLNPVELLPDQLILRKEQTLHNKTELLLPLSQVNIYTHSLAKL